MNAGFVLLAVTVVAAGALGLACQPTTVATDADAGEKKANECVSCHLPEYQATKHPMHVDVRPTTCDVCHTQDGWSPSVLQHEWPLTGAHVKTDCFRCHTGKPAVFRGTPKLCVGCHRADFDKSDYPGHADFPTTCADCHTTTAWKPATKAKHAPAAPASTASPTDGGVHPGASATAPHASVSAAPHATHAPTTPGTTPTAPPTATTPAPTATPTAPPVPVAAHPEGAFAIKSGNHADIDCKQCHSLGGTNSRANTSCVHCHARSKFDGIHSSVRNYPQGAAAANFCLSCHSRGTRSRN